MSKIKTIQVVNLKAIDAMSADLNGHTVIVTGSNNKGKSSFLTSLPDRIRGERPELILKEGTETGKAVMELTTGEKFEWEFDNKKKDKLTFTTRDGIKTSVTKEISARFFAPLFDIDKFLNSPPKQQSKQLQQLAGIDFTEIDALYKDAYDKRTTANSALKSAQSRVQALPEVEKVDPVVVDDLVAEKEAVRADLNEQYKLNKATNDKLREDYNKQKEEQSVKYHAELQKKDRLESNINIAIRLHKELIDLGYTGKQVQEFIDSMPTIAHVEDIIIPEPTYIVEMPDDTKLKEIDAKIAHASEINAKHQQWKHRQDAIAELNKAQEEADLCDARVKATEETKKEMLLAAKMPDGITFTEDGVTVDGYELDSKQISTSKLYCTALKLAAMNLAQVRCLHFDASPLSKSTLIEIEEWAKVNDLQLMIERPSWEDAELSYEIIDTTVTE